MADIMILLIKNDQFNLSDIDFVHIFALYLQRLNHDAEVFVNLLVECESFKVNDILDWIKYQFWLYIKSV